ncbi:DMBT1 protein, partial [Sylvietta virens]|nr:DMBT1 protein [Sylvietta virens]
PYYVSMNQNLFLQASLHSSDQNLTMFVDTCVASPNSTNLLLLHLSRCASDSTYARSGFSAFSFAKRFPSVFLRCELAVCRYHHCSSRCHQGCVSRFKRNAGS